MISSDQNIETITKLIETAKKWFGVKAEIIKIDAADKGVRIIATLVFIMLFMFFFFASSIFLALALAIAISSYVGLGWAFVIVGVAYMFIFLLLIIFRKAWVVNPLVRLFAKILQ